MPSAFRAHFRTLCCALICALSGVLPLQASDLYSASAPVTDQSAEQRQEALRAALETVLVRVTGDRAINAWGDSDPILARASALVQRYGYERTEPTEEQPAGLLLKASFDGRAVEAELRQYGLPIWGGRRPEHLLWIALRDDGQPRSLIDQTSADARVPTVREVAALRGLPVRFPLLDLQDRSQLDFADVWGGFTDRVASSSQRYNTEQTVIGAVGQEGGLWVGRWTLMNGYQIQDSWISTDQSLEATLAQGIHGLADRQAARLATRSAGFLQSVNVQVSEVYDLYDYGRVLNLFQGLNAVKSAQVTEVTPQQMQLRLRFEGDLDTLERAIGLQRILQVQPSQARDPFGQPLSTDRFSFRLVR